jgi:hypothetical protein
MEISASAEGVGVPNMVLLRQTAAEPAGVEVPQIVMPKIELLRVPHIAVAEYDALVPQIAVLPKMGLSCNWTLRLKEGAAEGPAFCTMLRTVVAFGRK